MARAALALEDGTVYIGESFGATGTVSGEVCFNTSMTGYQEILTDPSYRGQILCMTAPQIGNYGVNHADVESGKLQMAGFIVREASRLASNFTSEGTLGDYLAKAGVVGLAGIDTRALVRRLRIRGAMTGVIDLPIAESSERSVFWLPKLPSVPSELTKLSTTTTATMALPARITKPFRRCQVWMNRPRRVGR